jgi:hypothetical protein
MAEVSGVTEARKQCEVLASLLDDETSTAFALARGYRSLIFVLQGVTGSPDISKETAAELLKHPNVVRLAPTALEDLKRLRGPETGETEQNSDKTRVEAYESDAESDVSIDNEFVKGTDKWSIEMNQHLTEIKRKERQKDKVLASRLPCIPASDVEVSVRAEPMEKPSGSAWQEHAGNVVPEFQARNSEAWFAFRVRFLDNSGFF